MAKQLQHAFNTPHHRLNVGIAADRSDFVSQIQCQTAQSTSGVFTFSVWLAECGPGT